MPAEPGGFSRPYPPRVKEQNGGFNMPDSAVVTFTDSDAYHAAIRNAQVEGVVTARGDFRTELTRIDLHRLWMQRGDESLPRVLNITPNGERASIFFATDQRQPIMHVGGLELSTDEMVVMGFVSADHHRSSAACRWGAMSLTHEDLIAAGQAIIGREVTAPTFTHRIKPPAQLMSRLSSLHEVAGHLAKTAPEILAKPEVARALEESLVLYPEDGTLQEGFSLAAGGGCAPFADLPTLIPRMRGLDPLEDSWPTSVHG
jgi:hypothetical protein